MAAGGTLTFYAMVKEPPKDRNEYGETYVVLKDHLCPNCPVEEASVRWVSEPSVVGCQDMSRGIRTSDIRVNSLFYETMTWDFMVCHHV